MMQLARRASLVAVLLVLTSVGTASAECAWVLWLRTDNGAWHVQAAGPTHTACLQMVRHEVKELADGDPSAVVEKLVDGGATVTKKFLPQSVKALVFEYRCFPDTVDPRGPKK